MNEPYLTIYVIFEGLGISCFNPDRKGAEIAFLRLEDHNLNIEIIGSNGIYKEFHNIDYKAEIELKSDNTLIEGFRHNSGSGALNRQEVYSDNDPFDLRWLVDIEGSDLHNKQARPPQSIPSTVLALTPMFLPNAYFFTEQIVMTDYLLQKYVGSETRPQTISYGYIGDTLAAKIDAEKAFLSNGMDVKFDFNEKTDSKEVTRYWVKFTNICPPLPPGSPPGPSDFQQYYKVLNFDDGVRFEFNTTKATIMGSAPQMCEWVLLGKTKSLKDFIR